MSGSTLPQKFYTAVSGNEVTRTTAMQITTAGGIRNGLGYVTVTQLTTVTEGATAGVTAAKLPAGSSLLQIYGRDIGAQTVGTAGATINMLVGNGTDDNQFVTFANVSGANFNLESAIATAVSGSISAASTGAKLIGVVYARRQ